MTRFPTRRWCLGALAPVVALIAAATLVLPAVAEHRLRARLAALGPVRSLSVSGLSGLGLLRGHPDALAVHLATLDPGAVQQRSGGGLTAVDRVDLRADAMQAGPLPLRDVRVVKRDRALTLAADAPARRGRATLVAVAGAPALRIALPPAFAGLRPGGTVTVPVIARGGAVYADTSALPAGGGERLVAAPASIAVDGLRARPTAAGVHVEASAHVTG